MAKEWLRARVSAAHDIRDVHPFFVACAIFVGGVALDASEIIGGGIMLGAPIWAWSVVAALLIICFWLFEVIVSLRQSLPDFDRWDVQDSFRAFEAAWLWNNQEPKLPLSKTAKITFCRIKAALDDGTLKPDIEGKLDIALMAAENVALQTPWATVNTRISRNDLIHWAISHDERPKFLFEDARGD